MTASTTHKGYTQSIASALTTELNSLGSGSTSSASSAIDNTTNLDLFMDLVLNVAAQGSSRSAGATITVYMAVAVDGSTYDDANATTAIPVAVFSLDAATTARQATRTDIAIPPALFKLFAVNSTGQALAASGSFVKYRTHSVLST